MWKFIVRRLFVTFPQIVILSVIIFILAQMMPGDALTGLIDPNIDPVAIEEQRERLGLNDPWYVQYTDWVKGVVQGDFGQSFRYKMPVSELIEQRMINTFWLSLLTLIFTYAMAIPLGIISGRWNDTWLDRAITGYTYIGFAAPLFITALLMVWVFGFHFGWFPTGGSVAPGLTPGTFEYF